MTTIAVVTSSRADYSHLFWPLKALAAHPGVDLRIIAMASHTSPEFGRTVQQIEADGFAIAARVESLLSSDTDVGMAKSIGIAILSLADILGTMRPDVVLLIADRYEMLAPAATCLALRLPIAHIEGGERSEGAIDDAVRNALTKMAHIHFTSTAAARERVISMGEQPWRVHHAGAPSLDHVTKSTLPGREQLAHELGITFASPTLLVAYHPVTLLHDTTAEADALFAALGDRTEQLLFCYPNADAGSRALVRRTQAFLADRGSGHLFINLPPTRYWALLAQVQAMVGNSSSGIMETASFALPTVNVGLRQKGRLQPCNVLDAPADRNSIAAAVDRALDPTFRLSLRGLSNPYGTGHAAEHIVQVLTSLPATATLLHKTAEPDA